MSQEKVKGLEILLEKNVIKQGTSSLKRRGAVEEGWNGVSNYPRGVACGGVILLIWGGLRS